MPRAELAQAIAVGPPQRGRGANFLTGEPVAPSCRRTLTMSIGWITLVAIIPERPPLTNGLAAFHAELSAI